MDFRTGQISQNLPLVTICMSSFNYSKYIQEALNSLLTQTYPFIELIIIDDYSADNSVSIINEWIKSNNINCKFINHKANLGITKTSNEMVKLANGKYITLFASDDIMLPLRIERQVAILEEAGEDYGMCYAVAETMDEDRNRTGFYNKGQPAYEGDVLEKFIYGWLGFVTPTGMIRTSVYKTIGFYDERILFEDYNFWVRLFARYKAKYCEYPCIVYRIKKTSPVLNEWMGNNAERYYHDRILTNFQALQLIKTNIKLKRHLQTKISQYLKALAAHHSNFLPGLVDYLIKNNYFKIPLKVIVSKIRYRKKSNETLQNRSIISSHKLNKEV